MAQDEKVIQQALRDYTANRISTAKIAEKAGVSKSTISVWADKAHLVRRTPGRRRDLEPSEQHKEILRMASRTPLEQVGAHFGSTKQNIHRIVKRWKDWMPPRRPPFDPQDRIRWNGKEYLVLSANLCSGSVQTEDGTVIHNFRWRMKKGSKIISALKIA